MSENNEQQSIEALVATKISKNINELHDEKLTIGDRLSDRLADIAGSWGFIISFAVILATWITINSIRWLMHPYDPFPYILLNLVLSCIAAIQAPIIMMSQNRQESKDRLRSEHDYEVNLKAEILIEAVLQRLEQLEKNQTSLHKTHKELVDIIAEIKDVNSSVIDPNK